MNNSQYNSCVSANADGLYRFVFGILKNREDSRDVVQESFSRLWEHKSRIEEGKEKSYLFTIGYRLALNHIRGRKREAEIDITQLNTAHDNHYDNTTEIVLWQMNALSGREKALLMLRDWEGYSYQEVAQMTDLSLPQVKIILYRARRELKQKLSELIE